MIVASFGAAVLGSFCAPGLPDGGPMTDPGHPDNNRFNRHHRVIPDDGGFVSRDVLGSFRERSPGHPDGYRFHRHHRDIPDNRGFVLRGSLGSFGAAPLSLTVPACSG
jgi:hypothetical protein